MNAGTRGGIQMIAFVSGLPTAEGAQCAETVALRILTDFRGPLKCLA